MLEGAELGEALGRWLAARLDGADEVRVGELARPVGGFSAETLIVPAVVVRGGEESQQRFVLRRESPDAAVYPPQTPELSVEVDIQYRVMKAVGEHSRAPVAGLIGYEADASVLGSPFFVMDYVAGEIPGENPMYTHGGFFLEAAPDQRRRLVETGIDTLADVHDLDWRAAGLDWLVPAGVTPSTLTQIDLWERHGRTELGDRRHPPMERGFAWLRANLPAVEDPVGLCWGDPRPGNIIFDDFRAVCLTDFEAASIAPPLVDLGWWMMFDRWMHEGMGAGRADGDPSRQEQRDRYAARTGRDLTHLRFYEVFAAVRYTVIVVRVGNRSAARGQPMADEGFWLDNNIVTTLEQLLELAG